MGKNSINFLRLEKQILKILAHTLLLEVDDPKLRLVTFTTVKLTADQRTVKVFVDVLSKEEREEVINQLNQISGLFRCQLAKRLKLYKVPKILFVNDWVINQSAAIEQLIATELKKIKTD